MLHSHIAINPKRDRDAIIDFLEQAISNAEKEQKHSLPELYEIQKEALEKPLTVTQRLSQLERFIKETNDLTKTPVKTSKENISRQELEPYSGKTNCPHDTVTTAPSGEDDEPSVNVIYHTPRNQKDSNIKRHDKKHKKRSSRPKIPEYGSFKESSTYKDRHYNQEGESYSLSKTQHATVRRTGRVGYATDKNQDYESSNLNSSMDNLTMTEEDAGGDRKYDPLLKCSTNQLEDYHYKNSGETELTYSTFGVVNDRKGRASQSLYSEPIMYTQFTSDGIVNPSKEEHKSEKNNDGSLDNQSQAQEMIKKLVKAVQASGGLNSNKSRQVVTAVVTTLHNECGDQLEKVGSLLQVLKEPGETYDLLNALREVSNLRRDPNKPMPDEREILHKVESLYNILIATKKLNKQMCRTALERDRYYSVYGMVMMYQTDENLKWPLQWAFLKTLKLIGSMDQVACCIMHQSSLPITIARQIHQSVQHKELEKTILMVDMLITLFMAGKPLPEAHLESLGEEFIHFILHLIEDWTGEDYTFTGKLIDLLLAYNLQFSTNSEASGESIVLKAIIYRSKKNLSITRLSGMLASILEQDLSQVKVIFIFISVDKILACNLH